MKPITLRVIVIVLFGVLIGIGAMTFQYAQGLSYLSTDPSACVNCHIMRPQYDAWQKGSHHSSANCADCHLPATFPDKYFVKAENGWNHAKAFTTQNFHEPISINQKNAKILHNNCLRCHADLMTEFSLSFAERAARCVRCHDAVGHGEHVGLGGPMVWSRQDLKNSMEEK